jgi:hypothetical protein
LSHFLLSPISLVFASPSIIMRVSTALVLVALVVCAAALVHADGDDQDLIPKEPAGGAATASPKTLANSPVAHNARLEGLKARFGFQPQACSSGKYACSDGSGCCDYGTTCGTASTCGVKFCCKGGGPTQCFAGDSLVTRQSATGEATRIPLSAVRAGDLLLTLNAEGQTAFEPVLYLSHKLNNADAAPMLSIEYASDALAAQPLVASHDHLIFVKKGAHTTDLSMLSENLIPASEVKVRIQHTHTMHRHTHSTLKQRAHTHRSHIQQHTSDTQPTPSLFSPPAAASAHSFVRLLFLSSFHFVLSLSLSLFSTFRLATPSPCRLALIPLLCARRLLFPSLS